MYIFRLPKISLLHLELSAIPVNGRIVMRINEDKPTAKPLTRLDRGGQALDRSSRVRIAPRSDRFAMPRPQGTLAGKVLQAVSVIYVEGRCGLV
jgi:hypothetical protein